MALNIVVATLIAAYCAIAILGHVLVLIAIWQIWFPKSPWPERGVKSGEKPLPSPAAGLPINRIAA